MSDKMTYSETIGHATNNVQ